MNIWRIGFLALTTAGVAHGVTIAIVAENINYNVTGLGSQAFPNSGVALFTLKGQGGWSGSGTVSTNDVQGSGFAFPITLDLSSLDLTCPGACSPLNLSFGGSWTFNFPPAGLPGSGQTPYSVSLTGTGPSLSGSYQIRAGTNAFAPLSESAGDYNFSASGFISGNTSVSMNGVLSIPGSNGSAEIVLPDSFQLQVGVSSTPEPASFALAAAGLLAAFAGWRWRSRAARRPA